jgi:hypothetical protein
LTLRVAVTASNLEGLFGRGLHPDCPDHSRSDGAASTYTDPDTHVHGISQFEEFQPQFRVSISRGITHAELSFSKCSALNLNLYSGSSRIASIQGPSVVVLDSSVAEGAYTFEVTGDRCAFALTVRAPAP